MGRFIEISDPAVALRIANLAREGQLTAQGLAIALLADSRPRTACEVMHIARLMRIAPILEVSARRHVGSWTHETRRRIVGPTRAYYAGGDPDV